MIKSQSQEDTAKYERSEYLITWFKWNYMWMNDRVTDNIRTKNKYSPDGGKDQG